jgi:hypothetical protein
MIELRVIDEFRDQWLPHATDSGLRRLTELLESASPLLVHGAFSRAMPMGCLATQLAWHHPKSQHLNQEAGICWLTRVAHLNPATSAVILAWDRNGVHDRDLRATLTLLCRDELNYREKVEERALDEIYACPVAS